jgi:uncharacterized Zn-binding protein involved in type VI secretion
MPPLCRLGDRAQCMADAHGCVACPHVVVGPAITGSQDVSINHRPALRQGDQGLHAACCGPNTWQADSGSGTVFINGRPAVRVGDRSHHCGGMGSLIEGSPNVNVGG